MRMRFKPYARAELLASDFHVHDPFVLGGKWHAQYAPVSYTHLTLPTICSV